jgi:hypothetical protein
MRLVQPPSAILFGIEKSIPGPRVRFPLGVAPMLAIGVGVGRRYWFAVFFPDFVGLNVLAIGGGTSSDLLVS